MRVPGKSDSWVTVKDILAVVKDCSPDLVQAAYDDMYPSSPTKDGPTRGKTRCMPSSRKEMWIQAVGTRDQLCSDIVKLHMECEPLYEKFKCLVYLRMYGCCTAITALKARDTSERKYTGLYEAGEHLKRLTDVVFLDLDSGADFEPVAIYPYGTHWMLIDECSWTVERRMTPEPIRITADFDAAVQTLHWASREKDRKQLQNLFRRWFQIQSNEALTDLPQSRIYLFDALLKENKRALRWRLRNLWDSREELTEALDPFRRLRNVILADVARLTQEHRWVPYARPRPHIGPGWLKLLQDFAGVCKILEDPRPAFRLAATTSGTWNRLPLRSSPPKQFCPLEIRQYN